MAAEDDGAADAADIEDIAALHAAAEAAFKPHYEDPATGYRVFTASTLKARGRCCGCGCRHCPYSHENVPLDKRCARIKAPAVLCGSFDAVDAATHGIDVLLWSGGKDSFLAARALCKEHSSKTRLVLLTTFDGTNRQVAHQEISIDVICRQAETLGLPLIGCPLWPYSPYVRSITDALHLIKSLAPVPVRRVCTGDLHLEHIAQWRAEHLGPAVAAMGAHLYNPLWKVPYDRLASDLEASGTPCRVCAVSIDDVHVGELFDESFRSRLSPDTDAFGENGEFHTIAEVWDVRGSDPLLGSLTTS